MTRKELSFTRIIRSRGAAVLIALAAVIMIVRAFAEGCSTFTATGGSFVIPAGMTVIADGWLSLIVSVLFLLATAAVMVAVNRSYNLLRTSSVFFAVYFLFTSAAIPAVSMQASSASLLAPLLMVIMWILFSIYDVRPSARRVFLIFFLLGSGILIDYCFALYIPVILLALGQMKIFKFKKLLAALMGLIAPAWIVWGLGIAPVPKFPHLFFTSPELLSALPGGPAMIAAASFTLIVGLVLGLLNLIKIIGFNAQARAFNGFLATLSISTGLFAIVNFTNIGFYLILLNACVAFQVGHFFRFTVMKRGYIVMLILMAAYFSIYIWALSSPTSLPLLHY